MKNSEQLKLGLVGCGGIAHEHWRGIYEHASRIQVTAVIDPDANRAAQMAEKTGARPFATLEAALAEGDFAAVDIMLPHDLHEHAAVSAFAAGKHVLLEKPMSMTLDSCAHILAAAEQAGTVFMVAEQAQYWLDALKVQQLIRDGVLGDIITVRAFFGGALGKREGPKPWRFFKEQAGGGISMDGGAHWIRPLRMWLGEVDEVVAVIGHPLDEMEGESLVRAMLRFNTGIVALFDAMILNPGAYLGPGEEFRVTGTRGEVVVERGMEGRVMLFNQDHPNGEVLMPKMAGRRDAFGYELQDFASAVLDGKPLEASPAYSLGELRTALAIYRSADSHQWEKVWA